MRDGGQVLVEAVAHGQAGGQLQWTVLFNQSYRPEYVVVNEGNDAGQLGFAGFEAHDLAGVVEVARGKLVGVGDAQGEVGALQELVAGTLQGAQALKDAVVIGLTGRVDAR